MRAGACAPVARLAAGSLLVRRRLVGALDYVRDDCTPRDRGGHSVARVWNEALLHAIERDTPAPTVHARNLFHVSAAMWDAWAAYDPQADGWLVREKLSRTTCRRLARRR